MNKPFQKVLVANRGEIAVRVIRALREKNITSVAVFSEPDRDALHVRFASEAYLLGPAPSSESYLNQDRLLEIAEQAKVDAVHPGYGFLSENAGFARRCREAGIVFIGPSPEAIELMGDKLQARATAEKAGAPVVPGTPDALDTLDAAKKAAAAIGYPVMLKASAGGGGKGMRVVANDEELSSAFDLTRGEAESAFGDGSVYLEKFIDRPRHIEIQVFADDAGNMVHLGERECSLQRRHQKVIEEAPSIMVDEKLRAAMGESALDIARAVSYRGAGTVEFIMDSKGVYYFLEMNTRLQVEHPVTELVYGVDLVQEQISVAQGELLSWKQEDLEPKGWAIECRIYAENPFNNFIPSLGRINCLRTADGPGVRNDLGVFEGSEVSMYYDPMLGKLVVYGRDREEARLRASRALREMLVEGIQTNISYLRWLINSDEFTQGELDTGLLAREFSGTPPPAKPDREIAAVLAAVIADYEKAGRLQPEQEGNDSVNPWRLLGRPGALRRGR